MSLRPSVLVFAFFFGCGAHADGTLNSGQPDSGPATGGGSITSVCASICSGSGPNCGATCMQSCEALGNLAPSCSAVTLAVLRCADDNHVRCPSDMVTSLPAACMSQSTAASACYQAALSDAGSP